MCEPEWDDPKLKAGTMVRAALWLSQVVGEGNTFTKGQLRTAFPGVAQADRRVRDLRDYGWILDTNTNDAALAAEEQRFVKRGAAVWDPAERRRAEQTFSAVTSKERSATLAADGYQCVECGIAGGEPYPDKPSDTAVLAVTRSDAELESGQTKVLLVTLCKQCRSGAPTRSYSVPEVRALIDELSPEDRVRLRRWVSRGTRGSTPLERAWNGVRQLPAGLRAEVTETL